MAHNGVPSSQTPSCRMWTIPPVTPDLLIRTVREFLSDASGAVVLEEGTVAFDLGQAKYSISGDDINASSCGPPERNTVRRVLDAEVKNGILKLAVQQRLGQSRPTRLEICRERDRRSPSAKKAAHQLRTEVAPRPWIATPRHARCVGHPARRPPGGGRAQSRRRHPPAAGQEWRGITIAENFSASDIFPIASYRPKCRCCTW